MTKQEIGQIYYLNREIELWKRILEEMREGGPESPKLDGLPRSRKKSDRTGNAAARQADVERIIEDMLEEIQIKRQEIYEYISSLEDSLMRQIIMYRCMSLCTWNEVAMYVGGGNTADSVRMLFNRHFD